MTTVSKDVTVNGHNCVVSLNTDEGTVSCMIDKGSVINYDFDVFVSRESMVTIFESFGRATCSRLKVADWYHGATFDVNMLQTFEGLVDDKVPADFALAAVIMMSHVAKQEGLETICLPDAVSLIKQSGATIQIDNETLLSSVEVFLCGSLYVGAESMQKLFRVFGVSLESQKTALETASKITRKSAESFSMVPDSSVFAVKELLSYVNDSSASDMIVESIMEVSGDIWPKVGVCLRSIGVWVENGEYSKISSEAELNGETYRLYKRALYLSNKFSLEDFYDREDKRVQCFNLMFSILLMSYGAENIKVTLDRLVESKSDSPDESDYDTLLRHFRALEFFAVAAYSGSNDDYSMPVDMVLDFYGLGHN